MSLGHRPVIVKKALIGLKAIMEVYGKTFTGLGPKRGGI